MNTQTPPDGGDIRRQILDAAGQRFTQYGYNKTTMAEIAQDCGMSAANIYRYFDNKLDIGANLAGCCLSEKLGLVRSIVDDEQRPAAERLREVVFGILHYTHGMWSGNPRINELVNVICEERMDLVEAHKQTEQVLLARMLAQGVASGEFAVDDPDDTAVALMSAMTLFCMPLLMPLYPLEVFEQRADAVVRLILNGILINEKLKNEKLKHP
jgi:AcrR family transcriptional regulator